MSDYEKTSRDYLEAWRTSQAEMQSLRDALDVERARVRVLREALDAIVHPIAHLRATLEEGEVLNGQMAVSIVNDPEYLKSIAREALATTEQEDV